MSPAVVAVISGVVVGAAIWRVMTPAAAASRPRTVSLIRPERRRKLRVVPPADRPAELQIIGNDFLEIPEVRDISDSGVAISVPHKFNGHKPNEEVDLLLTLHGEGTVRARGAIRHVSYTRSNTATFGVQIVAIGDEDRAKIRRYVAQVGEDAPKDAADSAVPTAVLEPDPVRGRK